MGALRAWEAQAFGMIGIGEIYSLCRSGQIAYKTDMENSIDLRAADAIALLQRIKEDYSSSGLFSKSSEQTSFSTRRGEESRMNNV
jgi:hypothetical protein